MRLGTYGQGFFFINVPFKVKTKMILYYEKKYSIFIIKILLYYNVIVVLLYNKLMKAINFQNYICLINQQEMTCHW